MTKPVCSREIRHVRHSYYTFTTNPVDINKIDALVKAGKSLPEAIDTLAREDYVKMWGEDGTTASEA
jgi:uncharacterized protein (DUF1697 family)